MNGTIFDIKEFAIYDGPGVRQTVFLKGCPLHCAWCHNPEGLKAIPELGVSSASCIHCGKCHEACSSNNWNERYMRSDNCILCNECISVCPMGLRRIYGKLYTPEKLAERILSKADYYSKMGGGVTFSGGEPLMQHRFLTKVLSLLNNIHKAIETSAYADPDVFSSVIAQLDYVIMDIKCISNDVHRKYTGVSNEKILSNYKQLRDSQKPHTIRIPLIEGVSNTTENLENTAKLLEGDKFLEKVELLPYQKTAGAKYSSVDQEYTQSFEAGTNLNSAKELFEKYGLRCNVL